MKIFISGGAGFIGSHLVDRLAGKHEITVYDNLSSGKIEFVKPHIDRKNVKLVKANLLDLNILKKSMIGCDIVFHMAANPDIRFGVTQKHTDLDLRQGTVSTYNVLEAMRINKVRKIVFASSSVVYGEPSIMPTPEDYGPLLPISLYGASKLASESLITAFCHMFDMKCWIFRFANIVGKRQTHGILYDFMNKLRKNKRELEILGDGKQKKTYLLVTECADGILFALNKADEPVNYYNLGTTGQVEVSDIAEILTKEMGLTAIRFKYTGGKRGWPGDVPVMALDVRKINKLGWKAKYDARGAICQAVKQLLEKN